MVTEEQSSATAAKSVRLRSYHDCLDRLPEAVRDLAEERYRNLFLLDPRHPALDGLRYKHRFDDRPVWKVAVGRRHRALAFVETDTDGAETFVWYWIGSHEDYNGVKDRTLKT